MPRAKEAVETQPKTGRSSRRFKITPLGDAALYVELGQRVDTALNSRAIKLAQLLQARRDVREAIAGYASVVVHYDPEQITAKGLTAAVQKLSGTRADSVPPGRLHRIPVVYDGPDLAETAQALEMPVEELIRLHSETTYRCFMVGFVPGWAFLGPLPERLRLPRRKVPRKQVPPGSVAIATAQTGIYPLPSPGGWHLIGRTDVRVFLPNSDPPCLLRTGDRIRFFPA
ncbi:MAG: 5-oxoprolinase subunit PxpB [Candidatus Dormibacteraeota bacterium]|uniref:5-oxoprolinase subunit PxpB n=1 Tax=Candidatus Dormiibacter inghamiae TaxID=3127013 RepID=A0A934KFL2_9BACT|nr:5-oxoprolinase subunit PxpB [Candidatus Dormibacteraeota bacterium]MBJ7606323.1 5-oxoprolinase subunit PxpB [Candidatus Dormibacteraeota bacterium]